MPPPPLSLACPQRRPARLPAARSLPDDSNFPPKVSPRLQPGTGPRASGCGSPGCGRSLPLPPPLPVPPPEKQHATFQRGSVRVPSRRELRGYTRGAAPSPPHARMPPPRQDPYCESCVYSRLFPVRCPRPGKASVRAPDTAHGRPKVGRAGRAPAPTRGRGHPPPRRAPYLSPPCLRSRASTALEIPTREETYPSFARN